MTVEFLAPNSAAPSDEKSKVKRLLKSAAKASQTLADDVAELVRMRAWEVAGYPNFLDMWEAEVGFKCPTLVKVAAVSSLKMHTGSFTARQLGMSDAMVHAVKKQLKEGAALADVTMRQPRGMAKPSVSRGRPRKYGYADDELFSITVGIRKKDADSIAEIARKANVPNAEIYRQAVAEYLARLNESGAS